MTDETDSKEITLVCRIYRHEKVIPASDHDPTRKPVCPRCSWPMEKKDD